MVTGNSILLVMRIMVPFALGYYLSYVFRNINSVIAPDLISDVGLNAAGLGFLTGAYFLSFALFQLPLGVFLDRIGPRKTETCLLFVAAIGSLWFALADSILGLTIGRVLIGVGVSACLMASFKAFALWFPKEKLPIANGIILMAGGLGAMSATTPVEVAIQITNWRVVFFGLSILSLIGAAVIYLVVPEKLQLGSNLQNIRVRDLITDFHLIIRKPVFFRYVPLCVLTQGTFLAIQTLWVGPWLRDVSKMSRFDVAEGLFVIGGAMTAGYLVTGIFASQINKKGYKTESVALWGMIIFILVEIILISDFHSNILFMWCLFAFFGTSGSIIYAVLSQHYDIQLLGRVSTMLNLLIFLCAFLMQWLVGLVINVFTNTNEGVFAVIGYYSAFSVLLTLQIFGLVWFWVSSRVKFG